MDSNNVLFTHCYLCGATYKVITDLRYAQVHQSQTYCTSCGSHLSQATKYVSAYNKKMTGLENNSLSEKDLKKIWFNR